MCVPGVPSARQEWPWPPSCPRRRGWSREWETQGQRPEGAGRGAGGAFLVTHVGDVFIAEVAQRGEDGVRGGLAESAQGRQLDVVRQVLKLLQILRFAFASRDPVEDLVESLGSLTARYALAA